MRWEPNQDSSHVDVCAGDLVTPFITSKSPGNIEAPDNTGRPRHMRYKPALASGDRTGLPRLLRGDSAIELVYELDLVPFYVPYPGTIFFSGGNRALRYEVDLFVVHCATPAVLPPRVFTLREVTTTPVAIPRGTSRISVPDDSDVVVAAAGESVTLHVLAGKPTSVSSWGATVGATFAASSGTLKSIECEVVL